MASLTQDFDPNVGPVLRATVGDIPAALLIATGFDKNILRDGLFDRFSWDDAIAVVDVVAGPIMLPKVAFEKDEWPPYYTTTVDGIIGPSALKTVSIFLDGPAHRFTLTSVASNDTVRKPP